MEAKNQGIIQVVAGFRATYALRDNGQLWTCGNGYNGTLFTGNTTDQLKPVNPQNQIKYACGGGIIKDNGDVYCVGAIPVGNGSTGSAGIVVTPQYIMSEAKYIYKGGPRYVIKEDDSLWGWGNNSYNQLFFDSAGRQQDLPVKLLDDIVMAKGNNMNGFYLNKDQELWGIGYNLYGQVGDGSYTTRLEPVKVLDDIIDFDEIGTYNIALKRNGEVYTWGTSTSGGLGTGNTEKQPYPVNILDDCKSVACYGGCGFAIKNNGDLYGWGLNTTGQLADGTSKRQLSPIKIMENVSQISCTEHVLAIKENGEVWVWGCNVKGAFGNGQTLPYKTNSKPVPFLLPVN